MACSRWQGSGTYEQVGGRRASICRRISRRDELPCIRAGPQQVDQVAPRSQYSAPPAPRRMLTAATPIATVARSGIRTRSDHGTRWSARSPRMVWKLIACRCCGHDGAQDEQFDTQRGVALSGMRKSIPTKRTAISWKSASRARPRCSGVRRSRCGPRERAVNSSPVRTVAAPATSGTGRPSQLVGRRPSSLGLRWGDER